MTTAAAIRTATAFLWVVVVIQGVSALSALVTEAPPVARGLGLVVGAVFTVLYAVCARYFALGRNWARLAVLVLFFIDALGLFMAIPAVFAGDRLFGAFAFGQAAAMGVAAYLGYSQPGKAHFQAVTTNDAMVRAILPVGRSGWAIAAGYLALFSVLIVPAPFALFCGVMAVRDIRRNPSRHGMGRAVFGLVMGGLGVVVLLAAIAYHLSRR
jgi:hypothetical protein